MSLHFRGRKAAGKGVHEYGKNIKEAVSGKRFGHDLGNHGMKQG